MSIIKKYALFFLLCLSIVLSVGVLTWASNKGFDLSDEGYYIAGYNQLVEKADSAHVFQFFTIKTLGNFGSGLIYFRIARLLLTLFSCIILGFALFKWLNKFNLIDRSAYKLSLVEVSLISIVGGLSTYAFGPQTLSYNHYTLIFGNIFLALVLFFLVNSGNKKKTFILSSLIGVIIGFEFLVKAPTSVLFIFVFIAAQFYIFNNTKKNIFLNLALALFFALLSVTIICFPISPVVFIKNYLSELASLSENTSHNVWDVLVHYLQGCSDTWEYHISKYKIHIGALVLCVFPIIQKRNNIIRAIATTIFIGIFAYLLHSLFIGGYFFSGIRFVGTQSLVYIIVLFLIVVILSAFLLFQNKFKLASLISEKYFILFLLLIFPVLCAFGTNNFLHVQVILHLNTWFLFVFIVYLYIKPQAKYFNITLTVLMLTFILKSNADIFLSVVVEPYRIKGTLHDQTEELYIESTNETIYINKELKNDLTILSRYINKNEPGVFCSSADFFGLAYIFNKKTIGYGVFDCNSRKSDFICKTYNDSHFTKQKNVYFMLNSTENKCNVFTCFNDKNSIENLITVPWKSFANDSLFVYIKNI